MEFVSVLFMVLVIGLGIVVLYDDESQEYRPHGCYERSYYQCCRCKRKACKYHKVSKMLKKMEENKED